jgi:hypothetical protein
MLGSEIFFPIIHVVSIELLHAYELQQRKTSRTVGLLRYIYASHELRWVKNEKKIVQTIG